MGKDILLCFEFIEKFYMNFEFDFDEDIDILFIKDYFDGELMILYVEDSDVDVIFDDYDIFLSNVNDDNVYDFDKEVKLMSLLVGKKVKKSFVQV